jgi:hypothetical protein
LHKNSTNGSSLCQENRNAVQLSVATNQRFHIFEYHLCFGEMKEKRPFLTYNSPNQTLHQISTNWEVWILMFFFLKLFYHPKKWFTFQAVQSKSKIFYMVEDYLGRYEVDEVAASALRRFSQQLLWDQLISSQQVLLQEQSLCEI